MKASEQLKADHGIIKSVLRVLAQACLRLESGAEVNPEDLRQILGFQKGFLLKCHVVKEEVYLFPLLVAAGVPRDGGPIGAMIADHNTFRDCVARMDGAVARYTSGERSAGAQIVSDAQFYITLLREHSDREDDVLYVLMDVNLNTQQQDELARQFDLLEEQEISPDRHQELLDSIERLEQEYLP